MSARDVSSTVAVITGASGGIGAATAQRLGAEGFKVVVGARREAELEAVASRFGTRFGDGRSVAPRVARHDLRERAAFEGLTRTGWT